jgi:hypothetical protein
MDGQGLGPNTEWVASVARFMECSATLPVPALALGTGLLRFSEYDLPYDTSLPE